MNRPQKNANVTIIIPTYNRTKEIIYNLKLLKRIEEKLDINMPIIIGDDGSSLDHQTSIRQYIDMSDQNITYFYNEHNLGVEGNELKLVSLVPTEYAMLLGEDDYLNSKLVQRIITYTREGKVSAIIPNFYGVNKDGKQLRSPMYRIRPDKSIKYGDIKYFCYASQMSGLTFKVKNICEEYKRRGIKGNSYPHFFFIAYNLENGEGVHITQYPFKNTVLKKKQFDYSVDNLLSDLLQIINAAKVDVKEKKNITNFVLNNDVIRYGNAYTWTHPKALFDKVNNYDKEIDDWTRKRIKKSFIASYLKAPFIVIRHFYVRRHYRKNKVL